MMAELASVAWTVADMGYPQVDGYNADHPGSFSGFAVADGPTRWRQDRANGQQFLDIIVMMKQPQYNFFEGWYYHDLKQGSLWFLMKLRTGRGLVNYDCHMVEEGYRANFLGGEEAWEVRFRIEYVYSATRNNLPIIPGLIIFAGLVGSPSLDGEIHAGTPADPALDIINAQLTGYP
jgi:hypothetical protein